jgi:nucleotide-binding universal stress UspA family protein
VLGKILVGTDGSDSAAQAVGRAAQLAASTGAELLLLSAYTKRDGPASAEAILEEVLAAHKPKRGRALAREGAPADAIIDAAEDEQVDLIIVGNRGMTGARRLILGSVPNTISHGAPCSVLIVKTTEGPIVPHTRKPEPIQAYRTILVGTDGSATSLESVRAAAALAKAEGSTLVIVSAFWPLDQRVVEQWQQEAGQELAWRFSSSAHADVAVDKARAVAAEQGVDARTRIESGEAALVLTQVADAENADLLVVGNRGMTGKTRFLLGNVPNKVSHHPPSDVMIVKTTP